MALAEETGGTPVPYERLQDYLSRADIVLAATGAQQPIITSDMVRQALRVRRYHTVFLIDLSVPRNIDPAIDDLEDAYLFNIDDLSKVMEEGKRAREAAAEAAEQLVSEEADRFVMSLRTVDINDDLAQMNAVAEAIRVAELERSGKLVRGLDDAQADQLDKLTRSLVKKVLHRQMMAIRMAAKAGDQDTVDTLLAPWKEEER